MGKSNGSSTGSTYAESDATGTKFFPPPAVANETLDGQPATANTSITGNDANCYGALVAQGINVVKAGRRCGRHNGFGSANMRFRMEPTLHITDTIPTSVSDGSRPIKSQNSENSESLKPID